MTNLRALKIRLASLKINNNTMIEMSDAKTGKVEATDTLKSFYDVNEEDEEVFKIRKENRSKSINRSRILYFKNFKIK